MLISLIVKHMINALLGFPGRALPSCTRTHARTPRRVRDGLEARDANQTSRNSIKLN